MIAERQQSKEGHRYVNASLITDKHDLFWLTASFRTLGLADKLLYTKSAKAKNLSLMSVAVSHLLQTTAMTHMFC